jgi:hypothetical protein
VTVETIDFTYGSGETSLGEWTEPRRSPGERAAIQKLKKRRGALKSSRARNPSDIHIDLKETFPCLKARKNTPDHR